MRKSTLVALMLLAPIVAGAQEYHGPKCLGSFCIDGELSPDALSKQLGPLKKFSSTYRSENKRTFLAIIGVWKDPVVGVMLGDYSSFRSADEKLLTTTREDLSAWKTVERIGIGSSEEDVLKAYGKPSGETKLFAQDRGIQIETKKIFYKGRFHEAVKAAIFSILDGKVSSIELENDAFLGPDCLGPACVYGGSPLLSLLARLGTPGQKVSPSGLYCYQSGGDGTFLYLATGDENVPPQIEAIAVSQFPNCAHTPQTTTKSDLHGLKTPEGIGLGSSEEEVLKAYGKPAKAEEAASSSWADYAELIRGYAKTDKVPDIGAKSLFYPGGELQRARFGIRNGKVSYIFLSDEE